MEYAIDYTLNVQSLEHLNSPGLAGLTLLYMIRGNATLHMKDQIYAIGKDSLFVINHNVPFALASEKNSLFLTLTISSNYIFKNYEDYFRYEYYIPNKEDASHIKNYTENLKAILSRIAIINFNPENFLRKLEINRLTSELLLIIISYFKVKTDTRSGTQKKYSKVVTQAIKEIRENYNGKLRLRDIAKSAHVSSAYLSKIFKDEVGTGFSEYVEHIRFENALHSLMYTNDPIYLISETNGFSSTRKFIDHFKSIYQTTPHKYRAQFKQGQPPLLDTSVQANDSLSLYTPAPGGNGSSEPDTETLPVLLADTFSQLTENVLDRDYPHANRSFYSPIETVTFEAKQQQNNPPVQHCDHVIFVGDIDEIQKKHVQQQLIELKRINAVNYIEIWDPVAEISDPDEIETDEPVISITPYDRYRLPFNFIRNEDIPVLMRIDYGKVVPDAARYREKLSHFLKHCSTKYGADYMQRWIFIINNDDQEALETASFRHQYKELRSCIKKLLPNAQVGLHYLFDMEADIRQSSFLSENLGELLDVISFDAIYDYEKRSPNPTLALEEFKSFVQRKTEYVRRYLKYHKVSSALILRKWNTLTGTTRYSNAKYFRGALIFNAITSLAQDVRYITMTLNTEIFPEVSPFLGKGKISVSGIAIYFMNLEKRPLYFVLQFSRRLQGTLLARTADYILTETDFGYQLVLLNPTIFDPFLSVQKDTTLQYNLRREFIINGIKSGQYYIKKYVLSQQNGALYQYYERFPTKYGRDYEVEEYLNTYVHPYFSVYDQIIGDDQLVLIEEFDINAVHFFELHKIST
ncbi:helix-turn-helix domain-containing protein [Microvirga sp. W0021]|uniref:Helix-turn-helix domain-containing protein n=1 Tax=Hohaiivirga grylli TaxID=3133970 RepID=A0ABV0BMY1_9HYPH